MRSSVQRPADPALPASLSPPQQALIAELTDALGDISGMEAIALGGSHARGRAREDSDIDLALFYADAAPFSIEAVRALANRFNDAPDPVVTGLYEWGPWVNGGAWLTVRGLRVDFLYRSLEHLDRVLSDAEAGRYESHWGQQPPFGFFGPTYLGELRVAVPLADPRGQLAALQSRAADYPDALRRALVQDQLWNVEFGLTAFAHKYGARSEAFLTASSLARFTYQLVLALFALNRAYPINEKTVLEEVDAFPEAPPRFRARVESILGETGTDAATLRESIARFEALFEETVALAGPLYTRRALP